MFPRAALHINGDDNLTVAMGIQPVAEAGRDVHASLAVEIVPVRSPKHFAFYSPKPSTLTHFSPQAEE
jgi:hypothetical protein